MNRKERIIVTTGDFDPLSLEEINYLQACRKKGDWLIVGPHSDWFMQWARGGFMHNHQTRREILSSLKYVDEVFSFDDTNGTVMDLLNLVRICYPNAEITFVSHEDMHNMPETKMRGITFETMKLK